jgi:hypothetical protein
MQEVSKSGKSLSPFRDLSKATGNQKMIRVVGVHIDEESGQMWQEDLVTHHNTKCLWAVSQDLDFILH